ncbi:MAG: molybdopterin molybdenumtransferase MoeA [Ignavibacteriae bacterium]|nr:MAG: molybdopterin molybdenumtransferase MoeA [Ignavibacteriota bacterium]
MISYNEALEIIISEFKQFPFQQEEIHILDSLNRILAEDIYTDVPLPSFDYSAMDGIGIKFDDKIKKWNLIGEISAGNFKDIIVDENSAVYITTGGKIPPGVDTVIQVEDIIMDENSAELIRDTKFKQGQNIRRRAEDISIHERVLTRGTLLGIQHIPMAASCGKEYVKVFKQLKIGVLATGDELIPVNEKPYDDKIRCSNLYSIIAAVRKLNMIAVDLGIVIDNKLNIEKTIQTALAEDIDILISTGGVSAGKYDYLGKIYEKSGVKSKISKVNIKPGKPFMFGVYGKDENKKLVLGLPGNPISCLVSFILFFRDPYLRNFNSYNENHINAKIANDVKKKDPKRHFLRGHYYTENGENYVNVIGSQSSGDMYSMAQSNCLIEVEEEKKSIPVGESVRCIII